MTIFGEAAAYYKHRAEYPEALIENIVSKLSLKKIERLLDIGCGEGHLAIPLARHCKEVVAVDIDSNMIAKGMAKAAALKLENITWITQGAEKLDQGIGMFHAVTFGNSLHWLDIPKTLEFVFKILVDKGGIVVVGGSSLWSYAPYSWEQKTLEMIKKYLGGERRTIEGKYQGPKKKYLEYLKEAEFERLEVTEFSFPRRVLTADQIIEIQHSYSYATPALFGDKVEDFRRELKSELLKINPEDQFEEEQKGSLIVGWKR